MAYVYRHIRLDTNQPFYIGIAKNDESTYSRAHYKYKSKRNKIWLDIINKTSYEYDSMSMCEKLTNYRKLREKLSGKRKNFTPIIYLKDYNNSNDI